MDTELETNAPRWTHRTRLPTHALVIFHLHTTSDISRAILNDRLEPQLYTCARAVPAQSKLTDARATSPRRMVASCWVGHVLPAGPRFVRVAGKVHELWPQGRAPIALDRPRIVHARHDVDAANATGGRTPRRLGCRRPSVATRGVEASPGPVAARPRNVARGDRRVEHVLKVVLHKALVRVANQRVQKLGAPVYARFLYLRCSGRRIGDHGLKPLLRGLDDHGARIEAMRAVLSVAAGSARLRR
eukprot:5337322-Prymnesium_polylepis.1